MTSEQETTTTPARSQFLLEAGVAIAILAGALVFSWVFFKTPTKEKQGGSANRANETLVEVVAATAPSQTPALSTGGKLRTADRAIVRAPVAGTIAKVSTSFEPGRTVRSGQTLVTVGGRSVNAPFDGIVQQRSAASGGSVVAGDELGVISGIDRWLIEVSIPWHQVEFIELPTTPDELGATVTITSSNEPSGKRIGHVVGLVEGGHAARVVAAIDDPLARREANQGKSKLNLGQWVAAHIDTRLTDVVQLPSAAIHQGTDVWVMNEDGELEVRQPEILFYSGKVAFVRGPVAAGERVVVTPLRMATDGMPLRTASPDQEANQSEKHEQ